MAKKNKKKEPNKKHKHQKGKRMKVKKHGKVIFDEVLEKDLLIETKFESFKVTKNG